MDIKVGQTVESKEGKQGIVRYVGALEAAPEGLWVGIELPDRSGKNDGSVKGVRYFTCEVGRGLFIRKESVVRIVKQATVATRANGGAATNGGAVKPRPSVVGITADAARKRQSLMSTGSSTAGSRLSVRVSLCQVLNNRMLIVIVADQVPYESCLFRELGRLDPSNKHARNDCPDVGLEHEIKTEYNGQSVDGSAASAQEDND
jgi:hypothetical protein